MPRRVDLAAGDEAELRACLKLSKLNGIDPQAWLADVLARLPDHPAKHIDQLLPWRWTASAKISAAA
jgi:transposase